MKKTDIKKVLVIDDEEPICQMLANFLTMNEYRCQDTTNPARALEMMKQDDFDLVISDIRMGDVDGLDLVRDIRRQHPAVDVVVMSGFTGDYTYSDILEAGAVDFIEKPIELMELKAKITRVNRERRMLAELRHANKEIGKAFAEMKTANEQLLIEILEREEAEKELSRAKKEIESLVSAIPLIMIEVSMDSVIKRWNGMAEKVFQIEAAEALGVQIDKCPIPWDGEIIGDVVRECATESAAVRLKAVRFTRRNGKEGLLDLRISPVKETAGRFSGIIMVGADITEHVLLERQLAQAQKLEAIGQLAAGIAHEINTPTQYVGDNTHFLEEGFAGMEQIHALYDQLLESLPISGPTEDILQKIADAAEKLDFGYLRKEIPSAISQSLEGIERISTIVRAMKEFSHPGSDEKTSIDLNRAIESTITVARNEWKYVAEIETDFDPDLPLVPCIPGEINQVILNMIINAAHAITEKQRGNGSEQKGKITVGTRLRNDSAEISIEDTGTGIPENIKSKIFDPFFTTKEVGKGTGQGLAISHSVIVDKHGGSIGFESNAGEGAAFFIRLPLHDVSMSSDGGEKSRPG